MPEEKEKKPAKRFSLYALCGNKPGRKFTEEEYLSLCEESKERGTKGKKSIALPDGYVYRADSQEEIGAIKRLLRYRAFLYLRGQCLSIPYSLAGKERHYFPDFVLYTKQGKIIVIEIKQIAMMNAKEVQKKYAALKRFCIAHGYLYLMCDKSLRSYEKQAENRLNGTVEKAIDEALEQKGCFKEEDYKTLVEGKDRKEINSIRRRIGRYVASRKEEVKQVGDLTFRMKDFRIIRRKKTL